MSIYRARLRNTSNALSPPVSSEHMYLMNLMNLTNLMHISSL